MMLTATTDAPTLAKALMLYRGITGKSWGDILAHETKEWGFGLHEAMAKESPKPSAVFDEAQARGYRMGRQSNSLTPSESGISRAALRRADDMMDGEKSEFFSVNSGGDVLQVRRVRFSGRTGRRLTGGRFGNKFAAGSIKGSDLGKYWDDATATAEEELAKDKSVKRLNRRALASAIEISLRQRAAKGHTMAVQWLPREYKNRRSALIKSGPLVVRNQRGVTLGEVNFTRGTDGEISGATLSGYVPGTARLLEARAIVPRVEAARIADRMLYVNRKIAEQKQKAGLK
jgi:hypothetical protein